MGIGGEEEKEEWREDDEDEDVGLQKKLEEFEKEEFEEEGKRK